jgi:hypothetical protein
VLPELSEPKEKAGCAVLNNRIYVSGFNSALIEEFCPKMMTWTSLSVQLPTDSRNSLMFTANERVMIIRGDDLLQLSVGSEGFELRTYAHTPTRVWWSPSPIVEYDGLRYILNRDNGNFRCFAVNVTDKVLPIFQEVHSLKKN